jgi:uncharacterized membrane protein YdbT with pleckstrin-like domain
MDPQQSQPAPEVNQYDPQAKVGNALTVTQPGERTICEVKRHPIGIIGIYAITGLLIITVAVLAFLVAPHIASGDSGSSSATKIGAVVFLVVAVFSLIFSFISSKVYWGNSWVVTTDSLTQIEQDSLFNRQSSQLSLGNLEDVTAEQKGILPHMFNYGLLRVETAGERSKFVFQYCPNPNYYAQQILAARENFEQSRHNEDTQRNYRGPDSYEASQQPQQPVQQAGDPGYGAIQPPSSPPPQPPNPPATSSVDYPSDSTDQGVNINA